MDCQEYKQLMTICKHVYLTLLNEVFICHLRGKEYLFAGRAVVQVVSRQLLTAEARVRSQAGHVGFVMDEVTLGRIFLPVLLSSSVSVIYLRFIFTHLSSGG